MGKNTASYFDISRKIIANMTSEGWKTVPHVCIVYEADAGLLTDIVADFNRDRPAGSRISFNTAILRIVIEGIRACPKMNGHIRYSPWLVSGKTVFLKHIDISMPILYGDGKMITLTLPQAEKRSMSEIQALIEEYRDRIGKTEMDRILYQTGLEDTFSHLCHGKLVKAAGRLLGAKFGRGRVRLASGKKDESLRGEKSLTPDNIRQGSITVSNMGSLYRGWKGSCAILEIIPPQLCALAIGAVQKRAVVDEEDRIRPARIVPITIAFDHRALDFGDIVPFMQCLDEKLADRAWLEKTVK